MATRSRIFSLLLLAGLGTFSGCGNNPYPSGQSAQSIIYRTMGDDPKTLDPSVSYTVGEAQLIDIIYPSYFQYHYLKRNPFVLELALGAEQPKREPYVFTQKVKDGDVTKKGEAWTFRIKRGLKFQDDPCFPGGKGREIVAADFLYSFRRMADPAVPCPVLSFFQDKIIGFADYVEANQKRAKDKKKADYAAPVAGLQPDANDPYVFRILLNQPYPQLRYLMTMHFTTPLAHEAIEKYGDELARHPVGSGPYLLSSYTPKRGIVLRANPNRRLETYPTEGEANDLKDGLLKDAGKTLPLAEEIQFNIIRESVTGWNLFLQGYLDSWGVSQENYNQVISRQGQLSPEMKSKGISLKRSTDPNIFYFGFNMNDPVVGGYTPQKRKLRQAISLSIDSQEFIDLFSQGNGKPAQSIIAPGIFGYEADYRNPYRQFDPKLTRAKQLLAEAGYPKGLDKKGDRLTIYYETPESGAAQRQYVGLVKRQVEALGITLEVRTSRGIVWQDRIDKGKYQFMNYGWSADYPDPENFLFLLYGPNKRPGPNAVNYDNPQFNRLFETMRSMDDGPARLAIIRKMRAIIEEDCPWIYLNHDENLGIGYSWLRNGKPHPAANDTLKYRGVDGPERAKMQALWNRPNYLPVIIGAILLFLGSIPAAATVRRRKTRRARRDAVTPK